MPAHAATTVSTRGSIQRIQVGRNHYYKIDGRKADGVTTLIKGGVPKPALPYWSARTVAEYVADAEDWDLEALRRLGRDGMVKALKEIPWTKRDAAAARGTDVHTLAEQLIKGASVDVPDHLAGMVDAAVQFMESWRPAPVLVETVVASRQWRYAGTLDLVADLPDGRRVILDYKTSGSGIWPETALQLAAYRYADCYVGDDGTEMPMTEVGIDGAYAVWLRSDGFSVYPVDTGREVFQTFLHAAHLARQSDVMKTWIGEPELWA